MEPKVEVFDRDAAGGEGYVYTTRDRLSSRLANENLEDLILGAVRLTDRNVLDIGCGDGYFTRRFWDRTRPKSLVGLDPAPKAIEVAEAKKEDRPIRYVAGDGHHLPWPDDSFDVVTIQGVLHHDDYPWKTIREAFRVAPEVVILEPNGNNLGLKVIEKASRYHREHHERSYPTPRLLRWIREAGGAITVETFGGFVPMFCPDWVARLTKAVEPAIERIEGLRALACAVVVVVARRTPVSGTDSAAK